MKSGAIASGQETAVAGGRVMHLTMSAKGNTKCHGGVDYVLYKVNLYRLKEIQSQTEEGVYCTSSR